MQGCCVASLITTVSLLGCKLLLRFGSVSVGPLPKLVLLHQTLPSPIGRGWLRDYGKRELPNNEHSPKSNTLNGETETKRFHYKADTIPSEYNITEAKY
jgi:hypothetical protein